jgi:hypothetical protein
MKIQNIQELKALIRLCRKEHVTNIVIDNITMAIQPDVKVSKAIAIDYSSDFPEASIQVPQSNVPVQAIADKIATDELTPEQLMFYSSTGQAEQ